jgi:hypothetical protein
VYSAPLLPVEALHNVWLVLQETTLTQVLCNAAAVPLSQQTVFSVATWHLRQALLLLVLQIPQTRQF